MSKWNDTQQGRQDDRDDAQDAARYRLLRSMRTWTHADLLLHRAGIIVCCRMEHLDAELDFILARNTNRATTAEHGGSMTNIIEAQRGGK